MPTGASRPAAISCSGKQPYPVWRPLRSLLPRCGREPRRRRGCGSTRGPAFANLYGFWVSEQYSADPAGDNSDAQHLRPAGRRASSPRSAARRCSPPSTTSAARARTIRRCSTTTPTATPPTASVPSTCCNTATTSSTSARRSARRCCTLPLTFTAGFRAQPGRRRGVRHRLAARRLPRPCRRCRTAGKRGAVPVGRQGRVVRPDRGFRLRRRPHGLPRAGSSRAVTPRRRMSRSRIVLPEHDQQGRGHRTRLTTACSWTSTTSSDPCGSQQDLSLHCNLPVTYAAYNVRQGSAGSMLSGTASGAPETDRQTTVRGSIVRIDRACDGYRRRADARCRGRVRADQGRRHQGRSPVHPGADAGAGRAPEPTGSDQRRAQDAELGAAGAGRPPRGGDGLPQVPDQGTARRRRRRLQRNLQGQGRRLGDQDQGSRRLPLPPREHLDRARRQRQGRRCGGP